MTKAEMDHLVLKRALKAFENVTIGEAMRYIGLPLGNRLNIKG